MDQSEILALLSFLGLIALIAYLVKKDVSGSSSDAPPSPAADPAPKPPAPKPPAPVPSPSPSGSAPRKNKEQKYISIYEYASLQPVRKCAYCDGENKCDAKICCICGSDIDS